MRKFILKKAYPDSVNEGVIVTSYPANGDNFFIVEDGVRKLSISKPWLYPEYWEEVHEITVEGLFNLIKEGGYLINAKNLTPIDFDVARSEGRLLYFNNSIIFAYIPTLNIKYTVNGLDLEEIIDYPNITKREKLFYETLNKDYESNNIPDLIILKDYTCKVVSNNIKPPFFERGTRFKVSNWSFGILKELLGKGIVNLNEEFPKNIGSNKLENFGKI